MSFFIADPGSTHLCDKGRCYRLIKEASAIGLDAIKFQLITSAEASPTGNRMLPREWWPDMVQCAEKEKIEIFASVWDSEGLKLLHETGCRSIKFSYSQRKNPLIKEACFLFDKVFVTADFFDELPKGAIKFWTDVCGGVVQYPSTITQDFDSIAQHWSGVSLHSLNPECLKRAVWSEIENVEFHVTFDDDEYRYLTPDGKFSLTFKQVAEQLEAL